MVRIISFTYSTDISYVVELGNLYARFYYNDAVVASQISTPYLSTHLLELHIRTIGDTMWIVHPSYAPRKLTRTSATSFSLDIIPFATGPFMLRNDLIDIKTTNSAYMKYSGESNVGSNGSLLCCAADGTTGVAFFDALHIGALFRLTTKRTYTVSEPNTLAANTTGNICNPIDVKGTYTFTTTAFNTGVTGTILLERSVNSGDWEVIRKDTSNIQYSAVEDDDNVQYRARVDPLSNIALAANITVADTTYTGIVKVTGYVSSSLVNVQVVSKLDPVERTTKTKRWAEGMWSDYRTWPTSVTFFDDRCIYGGMATVPVQVTY